MSSSHAPQGVTLIGVGNMGLALATALLKSNHRVTIWNRTPTRPQVQTAIDQGAVLAMDLATAISKNNIIIVCLLDYETIKTSFNSLPDTDVFSGKTLINLTNGTLQQAREMQAFVLETTARAKQYFDGAIMVTPQMVGGPHSFLVISGADDSDVNSVKDVLSPIGRVQYLGSDITAASRFDLAALASMYGMFSGAFVGMGLLKRAGTSDDGNDKNTATIGRVIKEDIVPFLTALVPYLGLIAGSWDEEKWEENLGNPVGMQLQGVRNINAACREEGVDGGEMLDGLADLMARVVERYGSDAGIAGVGEFLLKSWK
ncbi:hypothetical protein QBC37DRAFT_352118 [Rhypophila decipiens]|uniref:6-phosphogluconate dehydrogenase NADP-binding domain-containing protein n=1 Tax=Rhypophila decipiens TaxID=261697 RepID=A0AAN6Y352_9PEZI|nr:hypothetical protein QBC37DRAFT_352118 [Rhypophila decipiens]